MKVLLNNFDLNGHTLGFHPQTLNLESLYTTVSVIVLQERTVSFKWSHTRVLSTDLKVRTTLYSIVNSTT